MALDPDKTARKSFEALAASEGDKAQAQSLFVLGGSATGKVVRILPGTVLIGRSQDCDLLLEDEGVSRQHAKIICSPDGEVVLWDLDSTNGTWVERGRVKRHELQDGDRIRIGPVSVLKYAVQDPFDERFHQQLYESATRDDLTRAYNKRFLLEHMRREIAWHRRQALPMSLLMIDVDHFKRVNDTHGHLVGDAVLRHLAQAMQRTLRNEDVFARFGGEEFACVLRQTSLAQSLCVAERLREAVEASSYLAQDPRGDEPLSVAVTVSIGAALLGGDGGADGLIAEADSHLYAAKAAGRNRIAPLCPSYSPPTDDADDADDAGDADDAAPPAPDPDLNLATAT